MSVEIAVYFVDWYKFEKCRRLFDAKGAVNAEIATIAESVPVSLEGQDYLLGLIRESTLNEKTKYFF